MIRRPSRDALHPHHRRRARPQRGVTLIVALVMLVIIGLTSAAVMRSAMSTDTVANNARVQTLAMQAAQIGLRYCESQVTLAAGLRAVTVHDAAVSEGAEMWRTFSNWHGKNPVVEEVPSELMASDDSSFTVSRLPQCIVQKSTLPNTYIVTSRGFSPDYDDDSSGRTLTGSVVWLQSIISG